MADEHVERATFEIEHLLRSETSRPRLARTFTQLQPVPEPYVAPQEPEPVIEPISTKIDHTLLPIDALELVSRALMVGKEKHSAWDWAQNPKAYSELLAKAQRHIYEFQRGVDNDPGTGLSHIACAIAELLFLQSNVLNQRGADDRFKS
jgi:dATP/dGTP diphosphohydrolase